VVDYPGRWALAPEHHKQGFTRKYWLLLMPFYFRKECPLNSGYLKKLSVRLSKNICSTNWSHCL
ncbi:TPA: hypothetical protein ACXODW_004423, partial [Shigella flexneri Y]